MAAAALLRDLPTSMPVDVDRATIADALEYASLHARLAALESLIGPDLPQSASTAPSPLGKRVRDEQAASSPDPPPSPQVDAADGGEQQTPDQHAAETSHSQETEAEMPPPHSTSPHAADDETLRSPELAIEPPPMAETPVPSPKALPMPTPAVDTTYLASSVAADVPSAAPELLAADGPALACACLEAGTVAVLHARCVSLWTPHEDGAIGSWHCSLKLDGAEGAAFHTLATMHRALRLPISQQPLLAAIGCTGVTRDNTNRASTDLIRASNFGASVFRLDAAVRRGSWPSALQSTIESAAAPPRRRAARHLQTPSNPTCAQLLPAVELVGVVNEPAGTLLALGGADGHVRLWRLTHPASEARYVLPAPHDERPSLATGNTAAGDADGAPAHPQGAVLSLTALPGQLGLLVGGFAWGAAMWQVGSRTLVNLFERQGYPERPLTPLAWGGDDYQCDRAAAEAHAIHIASLIVALPTEQNATQHDATDLRVAVGIDDALGRVIVGSACRWIEPPLLLPPQQPVRGSLGPTLAQTFAISRGACRDCEPSFCAVSAHTQEACRADSATRRLVWLTSDAMHVVGATTDGLVHVWGAYSGHCRAILSHGPATSLLACVLPRSPMERGVHSCALLLLEGSTRRLQRCTIRWSDDAPHAGFPGEAALDDDNGEHVEHVDSGLHRGGIPPAAAEESQCLAGFSEELGGSQMSQEHHCQQFAY